MSDYIPNAESMHFTEKCLESRAAKLFIERRICLNAKAKDALYITLPCSLLHSRLKGCHAMLLPTNGC